jgi:hypothetical protein
MVNDSRMYVFFRNVLEVKKVYYFIDGKVLLLPKEEIVSR